MAETSAVGHHPFPGPARRTDASRPIGRRAHQAQREGHWEPHGGPSTDGRPRGEWMRPSLNILSPELTARIVDEARRVLAEVGMEIRGAEMRRRLLDHGLPLDHSGQRVLFPRAVVE